MAWRCVLYGIAAASAGPTNAIIVVVDNTKRLVASNPFHCLSLTLYLSLPLVPFSLNLFFAVFDSGSTIAPIQVIRFSVIIFTISS